MTGRRKIFLALTAAFALGVGTVSLLTSAPKATAVDLPKVGFVNRQKVFGEYFASDSRKAAYDKDYDKRKQEIERMEGEIKAMEAEIQKTASTLTEQARAEKAQLHERKVKDLQRFVSDEQDYMDRLKEQYAAEILKEMQGIIEAIGKEQGFTVILKSEDVLYGSTEVDLTDELTKRMKEQRGKSAPVAAAPTKAPAKAPAKAE